MKYRKEVSAEDLRATTEQAAEIFNGEASSAFQLSRTTAVTFRGIILVHNADSNQFYLLMEYMSYGDGHIGVKLDTKPIRSITDFENRA